VVDIGRQQNRGRGKITHMKRCCWLSAVAYERESFLLIFGSRIEEEKEEHGGLTNGTHIQQINTCMHGISVNVVVVEIAR
jgi:hypothetical protein